VANKEDVKKRNKSVTKQAKKVKKDLAKSKTTDKTEPLMLARYQLSEETTL